MINTLKELIAIQSVTGADPIDGMPFGTEVYKALCYVLNLCRDFGFKTKNCNNYIGYAEIGEGDELIGILCHLDVVPAGNDWTFPPFGGEVKDGRLYGRGAVDDKGPTIAVIYAMKEILDSGRELKKRIRIIFGLQEESNAWMDIAYYKEHEELPNCGFTPDAFFPAIYGEKGILIVRLSIAKEKAGFTNVFGGKTPNMVADYAECTITGKNNETIKLVEKGVSVHGSVPEKGENAISKLMKKVYEMDQVGIVSCKFAQFYMEKIGFNTNGEKMGLSFHDEESGDLSLNVGMIETNADSVSITVDIRFPVTFTAEKIINMLRSSVKDSELEISVKSSKEPLFMDKNSDLIKILMSSYRDITGDETDAVVIGAGTYARAMDNIVAFGSVFPGRECTVHEKNEYICLEELEKAKKIYHLALERILSN